MPRIRIRQWPTVLSSKRGTILDTALAHGVPFPHGCRSGECGNCKCRLLAGEVVHEPHSPAAFDEGEGGEGLVLACRVRPKTDVEIAWIGAADIARSFPVRRLKARVAALTQVGHDVTRLRLSLNGSDFAFAAGQYARLRFGRLPARAYSMANRPDEAELEFHVRHVPGGLVSGHVANSLRAGDTVRIEGPFGSSQLREEHVGPIIAVAGGTGFAPIISIVRTALASDPKRRIHLYLGVRDERDVYCSDTLAELTEQHAQLRVEVVLSAPSGSIARRTGMVHEALAADLADMSTDTAKLYVAGPPPMVAAVNTAAKAHGIACKDIHTDPFSPAAPASEGFGQRLLGWIEGLLGRRGPVEPDDDISGLGNEA